MEQLRPIVRWLSADELAGVYSARYWNDIAAERKKEWWIADGDYARCLRYLDDSGLTRQYAAAEAQLRTLATSTRVPLLIADIAAGIGWASAALSRRDFVGEVLAVELSEHRMEELFCHALRMMNGDASKVSRFLRSFYDLRFEDDSLDAALMCQAFHHADRPMDLLRECHRVLRPGGLIALVGEHHINRMLVLRTFLARLVRTRTIVTDFAQLFPPDQELGDHYYRVSDYRRMFTDAGFSMRYDFVPATGIVYYAEKLGSGSAA